MAPRTRSTCASKRTSSTTTRLSCWVALVLVVGMAVAWCVPIRTACAEEAVQKRTVPVPSKSVSTAGSSSADGLSAQACAGVGDVVSYRLAATLPEDLATYKSYSLWFNDQMDDGLSYVENSVHARVLHKDDKSEDINLSITISGQTMRVGSQDVLAVAPGLSPTDVIVVEYDCTVGANAVCGLGVGNANTVTLQYSSSPTQEGLAEHTIKPSAKVYAFQINLHKIAKDNGADLAGARFVVKNAQGMYRTKTGSWATDQAEAQVVSTDESGVAGFAGLGEGTYTLVETTAPTGYSLLTQPVVVTLAASNIQTDERTLTASASGGDAKVVSVDAGTGVATVQVEDPKSDSSNGSNTSNTTTTRNPTTSNSGTTTSTTTTGASGSSLATTADELPAWGGMLVVAVVLVAVGVAGKWQRARPDDV